MTGLWKNSHFLYELDFLHEPDSLRKLKLHETSSTLRLMLEVG